MEQPKIVEELRKEAFAIGEQRKRLDEASEAVKRASACLVDDVVDAVKPALAAISNRVTAAWNDEEQAPIWATFRALHLWGRDKPRGVLDNSSGVFLSEHGDLLLANYGFGVDGESWAADFSLLTARQMVDLVGDALPGILDKIALALSAQSRGSAPKRTAKLLAKADHIRAASLILRQA